MAKKDESGIATKVVTPKDELVLFSYSHVFSPYQGGKDPEAEKRYSVVLIIPKTSTKTVALMRAAIKAAGELGKTKTWGGKYPKDMTDPLRDGDVEREDDETFKDCYFVNAKCKLRPGVVDAAGQEIIDENDFYSGCRGRASVNFFPYASNGNKGIACGLNNVQKIEDGTPLGGRSSAASDFGDEDDTGEVSSSQATDNDVPPFLK